MKLESQKHIYIFFVISIQPNGQFVFEHKQINKAVGKFDSEMQFVGDLSELLLQIESLNQMIKIVQWNE